MKRLAFNGGEISPNMALRSDMDVTPRSCSRLTNFNVAATGGITRRRGMRHVCEATAEPSILIPYRYDDSNTYLLELTETALTVRDPRHEARIICSFSGEGSEEAPWSYPDLSAVTYQQINALLLILSPHTPVMVLKWEDQNDWSFQPFEFSTPPWQTEDLQEDELTITPNGGTYEAAWQHEEEGDSTDTTEEHAPAPGDILRASYYTERREAWQPAREVYSNLKICENVLSSAYTAGQKLAWHGKETYEYFICTAKFNTTDFVSGCISPANYPDNFIIAEDLTGFDETKAIYEMTGSRVYEKGDKIVLRSGYWELYTCIRDFTPGNDAVSGRISPADYPKHFSRGIQIGSIIPCRGKWEFYCSGTWYGSYSIHRNYGSGKLTEPWQHMGESRSNIGSTANNIITGDEEQEECYLRLTIDTVRKLHPNTPTVGWVPDVCGNKLIVFPYHHHMKLQALADGFFEDTSTISIPLTSRLSTYDWSYAAFNARNGYPRCATLHESRLVLGSTTEQPQTIWVSRTDDLSNFATGELDNDGMLLTMQTESQASICWMLSHASVIMLGTVEAEWVIKPAGNGGALTPSNARIFNHGYRGSARIPAVKADGRVLYCERGSGRVYDYSYSYEQDGYTSSDLTIFADHIAADAGGITGGTVCKKPYTYVAFSTAGGTLLLMTYNTMHNINAWHRYTTEGHIESVCAITNGNAADLLYLLVARQTKDGITTRRIEIIAPENDFTDGEEHYAYTSIMETTAFSSPDSNDKKAHAPELEIYLASPLPASAINCSTGSGYTQHINHTGTLPAGWNKLITLPGWSHLPYIGITISGNTPCTILACQI